MSKYLYAAVGMILSVVMIGLIYKYIKHRDAEDQKVVQKHNVFSENGKTEFINEIEESIKKERPNISDLFLNTNLSMRFCVYMLEKKFLKSFFQYWRSIYVNIFSNYDFKNKNANIEKCIEQATELINENKFSFFDSDIERRNTFRHDLNVIKEFNNLRKSVQDFCNSSDAKLESLKFKIEKKGIGMFSLVVMLLNYIYMYMTKVTYKQLLDDIIEEFRRDNTSNYSQIQYKFNLTVSNFDRMEYEKYCDELKSICSKNILEEWSVVTGNDLNIYFNSLKELIIKYIDLLNFLSDDPGFKSFALDFQANNLIRNKLKPFLHYVETDPNYLYFVDVFSKPASYDVQKTLEDSFKKEYSDFLHHFNLSNDLSWETNKKIIENHLKNNVVTNKEKERLESVCQKISELFKYVKVVRYFLEGYLSDLFFHHSVVFSSDQ